MKILLLEDDVVLSDVIGEFLQERYEVTTTYASDIAKTLIESEEFDLFIFDINVAGEKNGIELLQELRAYDDETPAIVITAYGEIRHLKQAFQSGANDFIKKPFALEELALRIENLQKTFHIRKRIRLTSTMTFVPELDQIVDADRTYTLSPKDSKILEYLVKNKGRTVSNEELSLRLWEYESMPSEATIRSHIRSIREIIGKEKIRTIRGVGYVYE